MPFKLRYPLEVYLSQGFLIEHNLKAEFFRKLQDMPTNRGRLSLEYITDKEKMVWNPMDIFADESAFQYSPKAVVQNQCYLTRKVTVTPTILIMGQPSPEVTNRVLREFSGVQDRFLRVQFTAERLEGRINSNMDTSTNNDLYKRVYRVLYTGIRIGDRLYEFLAFGNS
jgi:RNA-dependent RNA polymerase